MQAVWYKTVIEGDVNEVNRLVSQGYDIDSWDRYGQTALMLSAVRGHKALVDVLVAHNAKLDVTAKYGLIALMLIILYRHIEIADSLIEAGADTQARGTGAPGFAGKTAADLAKEAGLTDLVNKISRPQGDGTLS
jgi:ankyrin repeat protein